MANLKLFHRLLLHDEKGRLVKDSGLIPSGSFVLQFLQAVEGLFGPVSITAKDVDNTDQLITHYTGAIMNQLYCDAGVGVVTHGVVVGTNNGSTPEDNTNVNLDTKILHSTDGTVGTLNYRAVSFVTPHVVGSNVDFDISRPFINETASTITVKEIGIIVCSSSKYFLLLRDVIEPGFDVSAGYTLTVVYTLRTTV